VSRTALRLLGAAMLVVGLVWVLQGTGNLGGSFMSGDSTWTVVGAVVAVAGVGALVAGLRRPPRP
jgi:hypothetical protein